MSLDLEIFNHLNLRAGCGNINLRRIPNKNQLISVRNQNQYCLLYSIAAFFISDQIDKKAQTDPESYNEWISKHLTVDRVNFPAGINDIKRVVQVDRLRNHAESISIRI